MNMSAFPVMRFEALQLGQEASLTREVTVEVIAGFAAISGDFNPVHMDEDYAAGTMFAGRIAHGLLAASYISAVLGTLLPGPGAIYLSQSLRFRAPVRIGDLVTAKALVMALEARKRRVTLATTASVGETLVVDGEALLLIPAG